MNFVQWLNSLDELLYELMSWLVFFPVTLWQIITRPLATMRYAENQLALEQEQQYRGTVSPPIMLILATLLGQAIGLALGDANRIVASHRGLANLVNDNTTLLLLRIILYATFALAMAARKVQRSSVPLDRDTLKAPFYAQCYITAPFALLLSVGGLGLGKADESEEVAALLSQAVAFLIYGSVEARWFKQELGQSTPRSIMDASVGMISGLALFLAIAILFRA